MKDFATLEEVISELESLDFEASFQDLVRYARNRIKGNSIVDAENIVEDFLEKLVTGKRNWNKAYTFRSFLFLSVKSLVSLYNKQHGVKYLDINQDADVDLIKSDKSDQTEESEFLKNLIIAKLKEHKYPIDKTEEMVLMSIMDDTDKAREIAEFWKIDVKKVYRANEKLDNKIPLIREILKNHIYE